MVSIGTANWYLALFPFSLLSLVFLVVTFWNDWASIPAFLSSSWFFIVFPLGTIVWAAYWRAFAKFAPNGRSDIPVWAGYGMNASLLLFIVTWIVLLLQTKQPLTAKTLSVILLEGWITLVSQAPASIEFNP